MIDFLINPLLLFLLLAAHHTLSQNPMSDLDTWEKHTLEGFAADKIIYPLLTLQLKEGKEKSKQKPAMHSLNPTCHLVGPG